MKTKESALKEIKSGSYSFLYLYFKHQNSILRINTGNKPIKNGMTKELLYNSTVPNYKLINKATEELKSKVDNYIRFKLSEYKGKVNQKECLSFIENPIEFKTVEPIPVKTVLDYYLDFQNYKEKELQGNKNSLAHYNGLYKNLSNSQSTTGNKLTFEYINTKTFVIDFRAYLSTTKAAIVEDRYLNTATVNKRLKALKTFYKYITDNEIYVIKPNVSKIPTPKFTNESISLSKAELKQIQGLKGLTEKEQIIIDMFICNSLMGLRFSDLQLLNSKNIMIHETGEYYIKQTNLKTDTEVQIELQPTSLNILKSFNFQFPKMKLDTFNTNLKNIFINHNLFSDMVTIQQRENNMITDIQTERRNLIHSHTCRRTFVNLCLLNNVPLNVLMKSTGHKNIKTLQSYIQPKTDKQAFAGIDF